MRRRLLVHLVQDAMTWKKDAMGFLTVMITLMRRTALLKTVDWKRDHFFVPTEDVSDQHGFVTDQMIVGMLLMRSTVLKTQSLQQPSWDL